MSLVQSGELLAVTSEMVTPRPGQTWDAFESKKALIFDGVSSVEVTMTKDFPPNHWMTLVQQAAQRPHVAIQVTVGKGERLYGKRVVTIDDEALPAA